MSGTPPPPPSAPPPSQPPGAGSPPGRSPGLIALCAVLGVLLGIAVTTIVVLLVTGSTGDPEPGSGEAYAVATCDFVEGLPETIDEEELSLEEPLLWQLQAVGFVAAAAGHSDEGYDAYLEPGLDIQRGASRLDVDGMENGIDDLRAECEENPPG